MAIDFADLYCLGEAFKSGAFRARCDARGDLHVVKKLLIDLFRGERAPSAPIPFGWDEGSQLYDLFGATMTPSDLISQRFSDLLRESGVSGWSTYPIALHGKGGELINGYHGLVITGRCGPLQLDRSRVMTRPAKSGRGEVEVKVGLFFDESTWDGSDMFTPDGTTYIFVTGNVKRLLEAAKISNVSFEPLDTIERMW